MKFLKVLIISFLLLQINFIFMSCSSTEEKDEESEMAMNNAEGEDVAQPQDTTLNNTADEYSYNNATDNNSEGFNISFNNQFSNTTNMASQTQDAFGATDTSSSTSTFTNSTDVALNSSYLQNSSSQLNSAALTNAATASADSALSAASDTSTTSVNANTINNTTSDNSSTFDPQRGVVKYVVNSTPVYSQPGSTVVGQLEQGDHPLVWPEGNFAKTTSGTYIPLSSLSDKGIGRPRNVNSWESQAN